MGRRGLRLCGWALGGLLATPAWSADRIRPIRLEALKLSVPSGFTMFQNALNGGTGVLGFRQDEDFFLIYVSHRGESEVKTDLEEMGTIERRGTWESPTGLGWHLIDKRHTPNGSRPTVYATAFHGQYEGYTYYGYSSSPRAHRARQVVETFLGEIY